MLMTGHAVNVDIFDFWADVSGDAHEHPADRDVLARSDHGFDLRCLPSNVDGRLKDAKLVLLFVNPGMDAVDLEEATDPAAQNKYREMRAGTRELRGAEDKSRAYKWLAPITKDFGPWETVQHNTAVLNIAAYHSQAFKSPHMLAALPSCRVCLDWAQTVLFPQAEAGERVVICLRAARFWGLRNDRTRHFGRSLFAPSTLRNGQIRQTTDSERAERDTIVSAARAVLATG
ncbi:hypothetical protein [Methylobacterium sp. J-077]|uniref:hypothetical protein n=1 Tax=Methylobacterium sp. J-077 TaxID=2836656 RepID=UPI001FBAFDA7|nr:hypothetical protein [Methylobacterium sp. J-077]MCJ2121128.1 hypothetical protein [Methylobacterium sp. J-077]